MPIIAGIAPVGARLPVTFAAWVGYNCGHEATECQDPQDRLPLRMGEPHPGRGTTPKAGNPDRRGTGTAYRRVSMLLTNSRNPVIY